MECFYNVFIIIMLCMLLHNMHRYFGTLQLPLSPSGIENYPNSVSVLVNLVKNQLMKDKMK